jgi:phosphatidylinositol glycan class M
VSWRSIANLFLSTKYFGKILFCIADVICGYIVIVLRRKARRQQQQQQQQQQTTTNEEQKKNASSITSNSIELIIDTVWWMYNPLPINICTRGSAESLVVLLPVLATVVFADNTTSSLSPTSSTTTSIIEDKEIKVIERCNSTICWQFIARATIAGLFHGISIHAKLYPIIYTVSYMANFALNERRMYDMKKYHEQLLLHQRQKVMAGQCSTNSTSAVMSREEQTKSSFPWTHPKRIAKLAILWSYRLFCTVSSITFLTVSIVTVGTLTYMAVQQYGPKALDEGLLYHFQRVDHRHNYSMYWYWIYLTRGRAEVPHLGGVRGGKQISRMLSFLPLVPQIVILGYTSLGIAPYDITFAIFVQTFTFVTFNKVITAQYFTWYLCLLPLCSTRICWKTQRMYVAVVGLGIAIITWLGMAFTLEMLGWKTYLQVWMASVFFFVANVNLLLAIVNGYTPMDVSTATTQGVANNSQLLVKIKVT